MFILKKGHQPGVYVPLRALFLVGYPSVVRPSSTVLKDLVLRNGFANQNQILCGASLGRGNDILFAASGSYDQDGRHAHIW